MRYRPGQRSRTFGRSLFAALFMIGGVGHWVAPDVYLRIMPDYLPYPRVLVGLSGLAEFVLGVLLLVRSSRVLAAWGLIALLIAVFPANLFMWQHADRFMIPRWTLLARLPFQGLLIAWAWLYTRPDANSLPSAKVPGSTRVGLVGLICLVGLVGCGLGIGGTDLGRLTKGSAVRTKSSTGRPIVVYFAASEETLAAGTVVKVVADDDETTQQVDRKVIVGFNAGPHQGLAGLIRRSDLEPDR